MDKNVATSQPGGVVASSTSKSTNAGHRALVENAWHSVGKHRSTCRHGSTDRHSGRYANAGIANSAKSFFKNCPRTSFSKNRSFSQISASFLTNPRCCWK
jgi:hypothetical protein